MLDSVVLQLSGEQFQLRPINGFDGQKTQRERGFAVNSAYCREYAKRQKKRGLYCPMVNILLTKRGDKEEVSLAEIQVSLSKLINGTNLWEVDRRDLDKIFNGLQYQLKNLGLIVSVDNLKKAVVRRADFSKVIRMPDYLGNAYQVVYALAKFNHKPQSDFSFKEFFDQDGTAGVRIKFLNSTQGWAIYDKMAEIESNGFTNTEKIIQQAIKDGKIKKNAVKIELSLQRKDSLEAVLRRKIKGKSKDFFLEELLDKELAKSVMLGVFDRIFSQLNIGLIALSEMGDNELLACLDSPGIPINKQIKLYYWVRMTTKYGLSAALEKIKSAYSGGNVWETRKEILGIIEKMAKNGGNTQNLIAFLRKELEKFEVIRPKENLQLVNHC